MILYYLIWHQKQKKIAHCKILFCNKANRNSNWTFDVTSIINSKQNAQRTSDACHIYKKCLLQWLQAFSNGSFASHFANH